MRRGKKAGSISTFLGPGTSIDGTIEFENTIRLDGRVKGKIIGDGGTLIIGEAADIHADINVSTAIIMGKVNGRICAGERVEVYAPAHITGDILAPVISIEEGVRFDGNCGIKTKASASEDDSIVKV